MVVCVGAGSVLLLAACTSSDDASTAVETTATEATTSSPTASPRPTLDTDKAIADSNANLTYLSDLRGWYVEGARLKAGVIEIAGSANPLSSDNESKAAALTVEADTWRDEALAFDAPAKYSEVQMWVERAGVTMADSLEDFWLSIKFNDTPLIVSAVDDMDTADEYIDNANRAMADVD